MKLFKWSIETVVCNEEYTFESYSFEIETLVNCKTSAIDIAVFKTKEQLKIQKKQFKRINICWLQSLGVQYISQYEQFIKLYEGNKSRKVIMNVLYIPFWKVKEYEDYYNGKVRILTFSKYKELRRRYKDEEIRRRYKIPKCEFQTFIKGIKSNLV